MVFCFFVLWLSVQSVASEMTCYVSSRTLNPTCSLTYLVVVSSSISIHRSNSRSVIKALQSLSSKLGSIPAVTFINHLPLGRILRLELSNRGADDAKRYVFD